MANRSNFAEPGTGSGNRTKNFKPVIGSNRYRIGPAYASLAPKGQWNWAIKQHFGYRSEPDDQGKDYPKTFICPQEIDKKTEMVKVPCAECDDTGILREKVELKKAKLLEQGKSEAEIDTLLGPQKKYLKEHNLDKKHLLIAKNESGDWGVLWLPWKALASLLDLRKSVRDDDGFDILSTKDGAWIDIRRTGESFNDTVYTASLVYETVEGPGGKKLKSPKQEALTDADFDAIEATCPDLTTVGTRLTNEQIERLVESRGDTEIVEAIFNEAREAKRGNRSERSASPAPQKSRPVVEDEEIEDGPYKPKVEKRDPPKAQQSPEVEDEIAILRRKLAQMEAAQKPAQPEPKPDKKPDPVPDFKDIEDDVPDEQVGKTLKPETKDPEPAFSAAEDDALADDDFLRIYAKKKK